MITPEKHEIYQGWIDRIYVEAKLTQWEQDFVDSIQRQLHLNTRLSVKQAETLERIYAEKTR
jgi:hypothetical protein